jgi:hypothetical protein
MPPLFLNFSALAVQKRGGAEAQQKKFGQIKISDHI